MWPVGHSRRSSGRAVKYAVSLVGARGYMQVMPFWTSVIGDSNRRALFDMQTNLRYGCSILRMYIDMEQGRSLPSCLVEESSRESRPSPRLRASSWRRPGARLRICRSCR